MDFQFWIWLIVIVITLIARANKKKPEQPPVPEDTDDGTRRSQPSTQPKAITFEDLLREIQGEKALSKPAPPPKPQEKEYDFVDYDDDIPDEIQDLEEEVKYDVSNDEKAFQAYEASKKEANAILAIEKAAKSAKVGKIERSEHFKEYDLNKKRKPSFDFLNELRDPQGFKKAFIMSEILNKKY